MDEIKIQFAFEKETANTIRFKETEDTPGYVGVLYLKKFLVKQLGNPNFVSIVITPIKTPEAVTK